jgi:hypothetical protein
MSIKNKNIKISEKHHEVLKKYCVVKGLKMFKVIEKMIDELTKNNRKDLYGE